MYSSERFAVCQEELLDAACQGRQEGHCQGPEGQGQGPKGQGQAPAPTGTNWYSYRDGSPRLLTPRAAKKPRVIQDSSDEEDSSNDSEAADTLEAGRF